MYNLDILSLGKKIKEYRKLKGLSIEDLGDAIGKNKGTVARYENGEIIMDIITAFEICNALNIDIRDICDINVNSVENNTNINPFDSNLLYLYYISKGGLIISSIEIEQTKYCNNVLMKNGLIKNGYKQEYTGILESNYNTAFICLTNAINNPGLDKFQIEIDLHSKEDNMYYGMFLGVADNTHKPTARKCIITKDYIKSKEGLSNIFEQLQINQDDIEDIQKIKYWNMKPNKIKKFVIAI